ncbi:MAG: DNA polymerase III subunit delta' [Desulfonatronovibrionaceae bacterium]
MGTCTATDQQHRVKSFLDRLATDPPLALLLEGGSGRDRLAMAEYWAMALNCRSCPPCFACPACLQIKDRVYRDLVLVNGEDNLKVDELRAIRSGFSQTAHYNYRVVIFNNAHLLNLSCANLLLKSLEEPNVWTRFILLAPLRENLLPTLVSRSFILTLSRSRGAGADTDETLEGEFLAFCSTGRGWLHITSRKNSVTRETAFRLISRVQKELLQAGKGKESQLAPGSCNRLREAQREVDKSIYCLDLQVNPAIVLDWLGSKMYALAGRK